jgi:hypothetical protein
MRQTALLININTQHSTDQRLLLTWNITSLPFSVIFPVFASLLTLGVVCWAPTSPAKQARNTTAIVASRRIANHLRILPIDQRKFCHV